MTKEELERYFREVADTANWNILNYNEHLTLNFCREFRDKINWEVFLQKIPFGALDARFMEEFADYIKWKEKPWKFYFAGRIRPELIIKYSELYSDKEDRR